MPKRTSKPKSKDLDTMDGLIKALGGCGPFQFAVVLFTFPSQVAAAWGMMLMAFGNYHEGWTCPTAGADATNATGHRYNLTSPSRRDLNSSSAMTAASDGDIESAQFISYNSSESSKSEISCAVFTRCSDQIVFDTTTSSTIVSEYGLLCDKAWVQSVIISIQMAGVFVGCYAGGYLGDRLGRRVGLYSSVALHAVANFIAVFSGSWQMYATIRLLIGVGIGGIITCSYLYPLEFVSQSWRTVITAIPVWNFGAATFGVAVLLLKDWRNLHIATAVLSVLLFLPLFWVPESMRWLVVHNRVGQAKQVANRIARANKQPAPNTVVLEVLACQEEEESKGHKYSFIDLFRNRSVLKTTIVMGVVWFCMSSIYYALSFGIKALSGNFYINLIIFSVAEVPGMLCVGPAANKLGRRLGTVVYFVCIAVACISVTAVTFLASEGIRDTIITVLALFAKMHMTAVWMIVTLHTSELYPTVVRNLSTGYSNGCARLGGILAPYLIPTSPHILYVSFLVMGGLLLLCSVMIMSLPETKGKPFQDLMKTKPRTLSIIEEEMELEVSNVDGKE